MRHFFFYVSTVIILTFYDAIIIILVKIIIIWYVKKKKNRVSCKNIKTMVRLIFFILQLFHVIVTTFYYVPKRRDGIGDVCRQIKIDTLNGLNVLRSLISIFSNNRSCSLSIHREIALYGHSAGSVVSETRRSDHVDCKYNIYEEHVVVSITGSRVD